MTKNALLMMTSQGILTEIGDFDEVEKHSCLAIMDQ